MQIFVLGAAVMGIAGAMLTTLDGQFMPGIYQPLRFTFLIWVMVIVGGPRHAQNMNLKRDSPGLSGISGITGISGIPRDSVAHARRVVGAAYGVAGVRAWSRTQTRLRTWPQSTAQTTNPPLPVPLPPEGRRGYVDGAGLLSLSAPERRKARKPSSRSERPALEGNE